MSTAIGIDLGTTRCTAGLFEGGRASALLQGKGVMVLPAAVGVDAEGRTVIGDRARRTALLSSEKVVLRPLALLGRRFESLRPGIWQPQALRRSERGDAAVMLGEHALAPEALVAALVGEARAIGEEQLAEPVVHAVVSVPTHFGDAQRRALLAACRLGGLEVRRMIHPTTAAALVYHAERTGVEDETIALVDLGAGGLSCAVVEVRAREVEVVAQRGLPLGGDEVDARIVEWLLVELRERAGVEGAGDPLVRARLRDAAEKAKIALSEKKDVEIHLPFVAADEAGPKHLSVKLTQARLEKLAADVLQRIGAALARLLEESGRAPEQIKEVLILGGAARMPAVHERVEAVFRRIPSSRLDTVDVVARGAAILAGLLASRHPELRVQEVLALPLTLQIGAEEARPLFPARAPVPSESSRTLTTPGDGRPSPVALLFQGERGADEDELIARFSAAGRSEIEVKLRVDDNQILDLSVRELLRGKEARLHVERDGIPAELLAGMIEAARTREAEARRERELREQRARLEGVVQRVERALAEHEKLGPELRAAIETGARDARATLAASDPNLVTAGIDGITALLQPLGGDWAAIVAKPPPRARLQPQVAPPPTKIKAEAANFDPDAEEAEGPDDEA